MSLMPILVPATVTAVACGLVAMAVTSGRGGRGHAKSGRLDPILLGAGGMPLGQAPVYGTALRLCYRDPDGSTADSIVIPKSIVGRKAARGIRPDIVNVFCQARQSMRALRFERIVWAEDALSGELVQDLHAYLGGAQPGGAPAPLYPAQAVAVRGIV